MEQFLSLVKVSKIIKEEGIITNWLEKPTKKQLYKAFKFIEENYHYHKMGKKVNGKLFIYEYLETKDRKFIQGLAHSEGTVIRTTNTLDQHLPVLEQMK